MKKVVSILLVFVLLIGSFSMSVSAKSKVVIMGQMRTKKLHGASATNHKQTAEDVLSKYVDLSSFTTQVMSRISDCETYVDVSSYDIPVSAIGAITDYFFYGVPRAFNVGSMGCSYYDDTNTIADLIFAYNSFADTAREYDDCFSKMSLAADKLLGGIKGNSALNDEQKLLLLHDRLALWNTYGYPANTTQIEAHTAYGALGNKMSVCQGYAMAYMYLLDQVGIDSYYCSSEILVHGWNIVFLNGKKYHVDVTWDDTDRHGDIRHDNFLRSSNGIYSSGHKATDYDTTPVDTKYDNYFWQDYHAEFQLANNELYYIDYENEEIKRYSDRQTICSVKAVWMAGSNSYWRGNFSSLASDGRSLFYSQPKSIYRFDLITNQSEIIFTPNISEYESIYGLSYRDETLICDISNTPNEIKQQITQKYTYNYDPVVAYGDVNGDNKINGRDYTLLMQYINYWDVTVISENADVNGDNKINGRDYTLLMQYINGWDVTIGK